MKKTITALLLVAALTVALCASALAYDSVKAVASPTYVRTGPGLKYKIVDSLTSGCYYDWAGDIEYDSRGIAWYSIYYFNGFGWVSSLHGNLVDSYNGGAYDNGRSGAYSNATSIYATGDVKVRTGPGTNYSSIGTLYKGSSADYTGFNKRDSRGVTWYQISYYGTNGWVSSRYTRIR